MVHAVSKFQLHASISPIPLWFLKNTFSSSGITFNDKLDNQPCKDVWVSLVPVRCNYLIVQRKYAQLRPKRGLVRGDVMFVIRT